MQNEHAKELRKILSETSFLTLPDVYDCLSAKIAEEAGFQAFRHYFFPVEHLPTAYQDARILDF